jgi:hypothetical protein
MCVLGASCRYCGLQACCELIECWNALGILWSQRADHGKSRDFIQCAIDLYASVVASSGAAAASADYSASSSSSSSSSAGTEATRKRLEDLHTHSLFYVAQAYQHLGDAEQAVKYCHMTMNRQLDSGVFDAAVRALAVRGTWRVYLVLFAVCTACALRSGLSLHRSSPYQFSLHHLVCGVWCVVCGVWCFFLFTESGAYAQLYFLVFVFLDTIAFSPSRIVPGRRRQVTTNHRVRSGCRIAV